MSDRQYKRPNFRSDDDEFHGVYDDQAPNLGGSSQGQAVSKDASNTLDDIDDILREAEAGGSGSDDTSDASAVSPAGLKKAESNPTTDLKSQGVDTEAPESFVDRGKRLLRSRKAKAGLIGGASVAGIGIAGSIFLSSLQVVRVNNVVETLQSHFFQTSNSATRKGTDLLLKSYLVKKVMPGMIANGCTTTLVNKSCAGKSDASTVVGQLYNTWRDAKLEYKMSSKYGLEIQRVGNKFYFRSDNLQYRIFLGDYTPSNTRTFDNKVFSELSRNDVRREMGKAFEGETRAQRIKYRFLTGPLAERKYNIRRCIMACAARDRLADSIDSKKLAFKLWLNERVIYPRSETYSLIIECALSSFDCVNGDEVDNNGEHTSQFERDLRTKLLEFRLKFGETSLDNLFKDSQTIREKGITYWLVEKLFNEVTAKFASKAIPIIGWIDLGAKLTAGLNRYDFALEHIQYVSYAQTAVPLYMMMRDIADESKASQADPTELASVNQALDNSPKKDQGGLDGEDSPAYERITGTRKTSGKAYKCDSGDPVPTGSDSCSEERVGAGSRAWLIVQGIQFGLNTSPMFNSVVLNAAGYGADFWNGTIGKVIEYLLKPISLLSDWMIKAILLLVPDSIEQWITDLGQTIIHQIIDWLFPNQITDNVSGARLVQVAAAGANFLNSDDALLNFGARLLTPQELGAIQAEETQYQQEEFASQPLFARMFSTELPQSLVSRLSMTIPSSWSRIGYTVSTVFANPFGMLSHTFGSLSGGSKAQAAYAGNIFGIPAYGWTDAEVAKIGTDPEAYFAQNCMDMDTYNKNWGETAELNKTIGVYVYNNTNPCLFLQGSVAAGGGLFNTSLIPHQTVGANTTPTVGAIDQATLYQDSTNIQCATGTKDLGIADGYHDGILVKIRICAIPNFPSTGGESNGLWGITGAGGNVIVNSRVSANWLALVQASKRDGVRMSANSSFRTMSHQQALFADNPDPNLVARPGYSNHQMGLAVDFSEPTTKNPSATGCTDRARDKSSAQWNWLNDNAAKWGIHQYIVESWHWDFDTTKRCGGDGTP